MHLYMMTRGIKHEVDQFITELQGKYLPFKYRQKEGEPLQDWNVQLAVRPIQLWEIVFPEDQQDLVLTTCLGDGAKGKTQHKKHEKYVWALRKMLGINPLPDYKADKKMPVRCSGIEIVGIGVKPDYWITKDGKHVDKKEEGAFEGL